MNSFIWQWWRLAWAWGSGELYDGRGRWKSIGRLYFLVNRRAACPLAEPSLYKQVYQAMLHKGHRHHACVDAAIEAVEVFGKHRAVSQTQLDNYLDEVHP